MDGEEINEGQHDHHRADEQIFRPVVGKLADLKQVGGDAGHDSSRFVVVKKAEGKLFKMGKEILTHPGLHPHADHMTVILDEIAHQHPQSVQRKHDYACDYDGLVPFFGNVDIQHIVGHDGVDHADERNEKGRQHIQRQHLFVGLIVGKKSFEQMITSFLFLAGVSFFLKQISIFFVEYYTLPLLFRQGREGQFFEKNFL